VFEKFGLTKEPITKIRGSVKKINTLSGERLILPTFHPAATIYNQNLRETLVQDLIKLLTYL